MHASDILMKIAYLEKGMIPWQPLQERGKLKAGLGSMALKEARLSTRRFRKYFRRALKWQESRLRNTARYNHLSRSRRRAKIDNNICALRQSVGINEHSPRKISNRQMVARRRLVHDYMQIEHIANT